MINISVQKLFNISTYPIRSCRGKGHNADGTQGHQDGGNDRFELSGNGKIQADQIIQEGKSKTHIDDFHRLFGNVQEYPEVGKLTAIQNGIASRGKQVGIFTDGYPHLALGKRPCIIEAITHHKHLFPFPLQLTDKLQVFPWASG